MKRTFYTVISLLFIASAYAHAGDLLIHHPYARATPPNAPASAVFVTLENQTDSLVSIVSASTPSAGKVELHTHIMEGDVMKMRQIDKIDIAAQSKTELKPGGLHIMLFELQHDFTEGNMIEVTITFDNGETQTFSAKIKQVMSGMKGH